MVAGWFPASPAGEVDDGELRIGGARSGHRGVLPHARVARHRALRAAGAGERAPQRGLAAPRPRLRRRLPAPLPLTACEDVGMCVRCSRHAIITERILMELL